jgi:hypothetical protein
LLASIPRPDLKGRDPSARLLSIPGNVPIAGALLRLRAALPAGERSLPRRGAGPG